MRSISNRGRGRFGGSHTPPQSVTIPCGISLLEKWKLYGSKERFKSILVKNYIISHPRFPPCPKPPSPVARCACRCGPPHWTRSAMRSCRALEAWRSLSSQQLSESGGPTSPAGQALATELETQDQSRVPVPERLGHTYNLKEA